MCLIRPSYSPDLAQRLLFENESENFPWQPAVKITMMSLICNLRRWCKLVSPYEYMSGKITGVMSKRNIKVADMFTKIVSIIISKY